MYDFVFITCIPSFYKINLYNELAKKCHLHVIFLSAASDMRSSDFFNGDMLFEYTILDEHHIYEKRHWFSNSLKLLKLMKSLNFSKVVVGGWDAQEYWLTILSHKKIKNAVVVESSIFDSASSGFKGLIKKFFVSRLSTAFVSGIEHKSLLKALNFSGELVVTGGVGLINRSSGYKKNKQFNGHFLYVGRLSQEKNLPFLVNAFKQFKQFKLTLLGHGPLEESLKSLADNNVQFVDNVPNDKINEIYLKNDVLLLVSHSETWGLVIEEALYYGLPVIVSEQVGCVSDLVVAYESGLVIDGDNEESLVNALTQISQPENYQKLHKNVSMIDFDKRFHEQINSYLKVIQSNESV